MRGRPGCPTGQEKHSVGATAGSPPFFISTRKGWVQDRPLIRPSVRTGAPSPQGEGFELCCPFPSAKPPLPARPAGGRAVTGVRYRAAGQAEKRENPPGSPQPEKVGPGRKNLFLPGVLSSGFLPKKAGLPRRSRRAPGALRPEAASEPPTRRVRSTASKKSTCKPLYSIV